MLRRTVLLLGWMLGAVPMVGLMAQGYKAPAGVTILTEDEILTMIVGNTLVGAKEPWVEYYKPDGTKKRGLIRGLWEGSQRYKGRWKIKGSLWCLSYPDDPDSNGCWTLALIGDKVEWYKPNGKEDPPPSTLLLGNPKNL